MTLLVNLFGGPGTSKSTNAALSFGLLKLHGINAEMAHEFAKDLTWEERTGALAFQPYVLGKQAYRIHRLMEKVDVVITDSPILLTIIYGQGRYGKHFDEYVRHLHSTYNSLNIFLERNPDAHPYNPKGRNQTEEEAKLIDNKIEALLYYSTEFTRLPVRDGMWTANKICELIYERIK